MKYFLVFLISISSYAKINGEFYSEFSKDKMECAIGAKIKSHKTNEIIFEQWDMLCEDNLGNSIESSLEDKMKYEKVGPKKLKVTQGTESITIDAKILDFTDDFVHYNFEVETEDGLLEINEDYALKENNLIFNSLYILDGKEIIKNNGILERKK